MMLQNVNIALLQKKLPKSISICDMFIENLTSKILAQYNIFQI